MIFINSRKRKPWEWLDDWQQSDRGYDPNELKHINERMQADWPGAYKIVRKTSPYGRFKYYEMEFDSPAEETMFRLKYS